MTETPTPQAMTDLLRTAGFSETVATREPRQHVTHTAGFHVMDGCGEVRVIWLQESVPPTQRTSGYVAAERGQCRIVRGQIAEVLRTAGYAAEDDGRALHVWQPGEEG